MRVKLLIALAIASIIILAGSLPAGAVEGVTGVSGTAISVGTPFQVPLVAPSAIVPCVSFTATPAPLAYTYGTVSPINLGGPALQTEIALSPPQVPSFVSPNFVLPQLCPPVISPFIATSPAFDP